MNEIQNIIINFEEQLLLFINGLHFPLGDLAMWHISGKFFWIPLYVFLLALVFKKLKFTKGILCLFIIILMIFCADQLGDSVIRPIFCRLRPSSPLNPISEFLYFVNDYRGGSFGFPSCHAANTFALATFLTLLFKQRWMSIFLITWAISVSCSRIYLGVHYPTDILAGAFIGIFMGYNFNLIFNFLINSRLFNTSYSQTSKDI